MAQRDLLLDYRISESSPGVTTYPGGVKMPCKKCGTEVDTKDARWTNKGKPKKPKNPDKKLRYAGVACGGCGVTYSFDTAEVDA